MPLISKDTLYPGTYRLADGRSVTFTRDGVRRVHGQLIDMLGAGLSIPLVLEHQATVPMTRGERLAHQVKSTIGWIEGAHLDSGGALITAINVPLPEDVRRLSAVRYVSPMLTDDFTDGDGRLWGGQSLLHVAATARPVQQHQRPFAVPLSRAFALSMSDFVPLSQKELSMSENANLWNECRTHLTALGIVIGENENPYEDLESFLKTLAAVAGTLAREKAKTEPRPEVAPVVMSHEASQETALNNARRNAGLSGDQIRELEYQDECRRREKERTYRDKVLADYDAMKKTRL